MLTAYQREIKVFFYFLLLIVLFLFVLKYTRNIHNEDTMKLQEGRMDLTQFNFANSSLSLDGTWEIYPGKLLNPEDFQNNKQYQPIYTTLQSWDKLGLKDIHVATYRAIIQKNDVVQDFGLKLDDVYTSYCLYVNGKLTHGIYAIDGQLPDNNIKNTSDYHFFSTDDKEIELIVQVSNDEFSVGGMTIAPMLGSARNIHLMMDRLQASFVFVITILVTISIFCLSFYLAKDDEANVVFLGLASLSYVIKILLSTSGPLSFIYYFIPYYLLIRLYLSFTILNLCFVYQYFYDTFKNDCGRLLKYVQYALVFFIGLILFSGNQWLYFMSTGVIVVTVSIYLICFLLAAQALFVRKRNVVFHFIGSFTLLFSFLLDMRRVDISAFSAVGLFLFATLALSDVIKDSLYSYNNLRQIKNNLEVEIENRTIELFSINKNLVFEKKARMTAEKSLKMLSNYDPLTGVYNKIYATKYLEDTMSVFRRHRHKFSVIVFELDESSYIFETFGPKIQNKVIIETLDVIKTLLRRTDLLAKWSDTVFIIIMPNCLEKNAINVAEKVRYCVAENIIEGFGGATISLGVATVDTEDDANTLLFRSEQNLYKAKKLGKNCCFPKG